MDGYLCRPCSPVVTPELARGTFDMTTFPMDELRSTDNVSVHVFDIIWGFNDDIDMQELGRLYKQACEQGDLQLLPSRFGLKERCPKETKLQMVICNCNDGSKVILKHIMFPQKMKACLFEKMVYGRPHRAKWMTGSPKTGRKILQYCLEHLGGFVFTNAELKSR